MSIFLNTPTAQVQVYVWGAGGGGGNAGGWNNGSYGGGGGFSSGKLLVKAGDVYQITVGGGGFARTGGEATGYKTYTEGGGGSPLCNVTDNRWGGWGGGLSGVFLNYSYNVGAVTAVPQVYNSSTVVLIAGGGGGGGAGPKTCQVTTRGTALMSGGAGGGLVGQRGASPGSNLILCYSQYGTNPSGGGGGTQTIPGYGGFGPNRLITAASTGSQFLGARLASALSPNGGGGGGGWFGGGLGGYNDTPGIMAGGGGGSGYINQSLVFCAVTITGCYATPGCNTNIFRGSAGNGGAVNGTGENGRVVIAYPGPQIASGGTITTSSNTTIHTFNQSGAFAIFGFGSTSTQVNLLIVGGGGGGGDNMGGGGGAGAVITAISTMSSGAYQITVGSGGLGAVAAARPALIGDYSSIRSLTQNSYSYLFQAPTDYVYTGQSVGDAYGIGTARVYFNAMAFNDCNFTLEGWYWLFDGAAQVSRAFFTNYAAINTALTTHSIYFGKHGDYEGRVVFWAGSVNSTRPMLIDPEYPPTGKWVHYAISRNNNDFTLFRDGVSVAAATTSSAITSGTVLANYLSLPSVQINSVNTGSYRGYMSNIRMVTGGSVYTTGVSTASTATTFSGVFNGTSDSISVPGVIGSVGTNDFNLETWVYHTTTANAASTSSAVTYVDQPNTVGAMYFTGVSSQLVYNWNTNIFSLGSAPFTVEAWIFATYLGPTTSIAATTTANDDLGFRWYFGSNGFGVRSYGTNWVLPGDLTKVTAMTWHHVAFTRGPNNLMSTWLDGVLHNSNRTQTPNWTSGALQIGSGDGNFPGYIKDFRFVKGATLYAQNTASFTVSTTAPLSVNQYTTILFTATSAGYTITDGTGYTSLPSAPNGLVSYSSLTPFSGIGGSAVFQPSTTIGGYITLPPSSSAYSLAGDFTIEAWIYPTAVLAGVWAIIDARPGQQQATSWVFGLNPSNKIVFYNATSYIGLTTIPLNSWSHVCVQRTGTSIMFHYNGVFDGVYTFNGAPGNFAPTGSTTPIVGSKDWPVSVGYGTLGYIANIRISNGYALYGGQFTPPTTALTTSSATTASWQFLLLPDNPITYTNDVAGNMPAPITQSNVSYALVSPAPYGDAGLNFYRNASGKAELATASGSPKLSTTVTSQTILLPYKWYHLAVSRSGTTTRLFVNGVLEATNANNSTNYTSTYPFNIGGSTRQGNLQSNFTGYMHGLRLTNGSAVYTGNFTVPAITLSTTTDAGTNINAITTQTVLLTLQNSTLIDNSTNQLVITNNGVTGIWPNTPFSTATIFTVPTTQLTNVQSSGTNINAVISRDATGYAVGSFMFTPSNSEYLTIPSAYQNALTGDFTIEAWVNMQFPPESGAAGIIGYGPSTGGSSLRVNSSGILQYWLNGVGNVVTGVTPLSQNKWYHIALQRGGLAPVITTTYGSIGSLYFNGVGGGATATKLITPANNNLFGFGTGDFTVEAWIYPTASPSNLGQIIGGHNSGSNADWILGLLATTNYITFYGPNGSTNVTSVSGVTLNQWTHVAVVNAGTIPSIYFNGVLNKTGTVGNLASISNLSTPITIGGDNTGNANSAFIGYISNLRVVKGLAVYTGAFTVPNYLLKVTQAANPGGGINTQAILTATYTSLLLDVIGSSGYITDTGGNNLTLTNNASGVAYNTLFPPIATSALGSLLFVGTSLQYLSIPSNTAFDQNVPFTWECWFYPTSITSGYVWGITGSSMLEVGVGIGGVPGKIYVDRSGVGMQITSNTTITANSWYHVALCYDGTNTRLFLNGVLEGTISGGGVAASQPLWIGNYNNGAQHFSGYITNFRITKAALYTAAFSPNVPLASLANTTLLLLVSNDANKIIDSASGLTVTNNNGATFSTNVPSASSTVNANSVSTPLSPAINLYINGVLEPVNGQSSYSIPGSSIVIGRTYTDTIGEYFNGYITNVRVSRRLIYTTAQTPASPLTPITLSNGATTRLLLSAAASNSYLTDSSASANILSPSVTSFAYYTAFTGTQYLTITNSVFNNLGTNNFTIEGWVYMTSYNPVTPGPALFGTVGGAQTGYAINLGFDISSLSVKSNASGAFQDDLIVATGYGVPLNEWTHIAFVRNYDLIQLFKNGIVVASRTGAATWNYGGTGGVGYIGYYNTGALIRYFSGSISNVRVVTGVAVYSSVPTSPLRVTTGTVTLLNVESSGAYLVDSGIGVYSGIIITNTGGVTYSASGPPISGTNGSLVFSGTGQYLSFTNSSAANSLYDLSTAAPDWTVECWVKITTLPATGTRGTILQRGWPGSVNNPEYGFTVNNSGGISTIEFWANNTIASSPTISAAGTWYHLATSRQGNTIRHYFNGFIVGTLIGGTMLATQGRELIIGAATGGLNLLAMSISNIRIVKFKGLYGDSAFIPSTRPLATTQTNVQFYVGQDSVAAISTASYTSLLTLQSNGIVDNSTFGSAISQSSGTFTTSTVVFPSYSSSGPYVNTGSIFFPPTTLPSIGSYLTVTNALLYPAINQDFTIELWVNNNTHRGRVNYPVVFSTANYSTGTSTVGSMVLYAGNTNIPGASTTTYTLQITGIRNNNTTSNQISIASPIQVGVWTHLAITRASSAITVFVNGIVNGVGTYIGPISSSGDNTWYIGGTGTYNSQNRTAFSGYISNFRVVVGTAIYSKNFTPPTRPLTVSSGTFTTLLLASPYINPGNPASIVSYNDTSLWNNIPTTVSPGRPPTALGPVISILNPFNNTGSVSLLTANSPLIAVDYSPHSFNMIKSRDVSSSTFSPFYNDLPIVQTGMYSNATIAGYSAWFDGLGSKSGLIIQPASQLHLPGDFTIEFWMYSNGGLAGPNNRYNNAMFIINKGGIQTTNITTSSYEILYSYPGVFFSASTGTTTSTSNNSLIGGRPDNGRDGLMGNIKGPNTWNHVAVSRQGNTIRGFVNGVQGLTTTTQFSLYDSATVATNDTTRSWLGKGLAIGMGFDGTWGTVSTMQTDYTGNLSNLRIIKNQGIYTGNFNPPAQTLTIDSIGTSGANVAGSITGTTALLMFHTANPLYEGTGMLFTSTSSYTYFGPIYPQSTNPFGPASDAVTTALALGGGGGASSIVTKATPASIGANGGGSSPDHLNSPAAAPGIMGIPGGGYAGAVSTGTYFGAGGAGAGGSGYIGGKSTPGAGQGGVGIISSILGTPYYFGGGGGGAAYTLPGAAGSGGLGGGGGGSPKSIYGGGYGDRSSIFHAQDAGFGLLCSAATNQPGGHAAANSGGGGGASSYAAATYGGNGGSGIVAISYPSPQKALGGVITTVGTSTIHTFYASGVFTMLAPTIYPQDQGGVGGNGYPAGGGGAAGMIYIGGIGGSAGSTGTAVLFGGGGAGGASSSTAFASGGGGASIYSAVNKLTMSNLQQAGQSADGANFSNIVSGGGANFGGGGGGGAYPAAISGIGCGGSGALLIVYNTTSTTYSFPNPSPTVYSTLNIGAQPSYPYGASASTPNPSLLVLTTGTTCKSRKTIFPNFVSVSESFNSENLKTGKNAVYNDQSATINVARNIYAQCLNSGNIQLTTYISSHEMMMKNNDKALPATYNTPGNYQVIQEVNKANDPRLVNARVANFIVGVTGATGTTGTAGTTVNQYWNGS